MPGAAGAAISGVGNAIGMGIQTRMNQRMTAEARDYNTMMANTAYRRAVIDMRAAGLNPMLAYMQGGAASPPTSAAQVPDLGGNVSKAVSSSLDAAAFHQELRNLRQQERVGQAAVRKTNAETRTERNKYYALQWSAERDREQAYWQRKQTDAAEPYLKMQEKFFKSDLGKIYFDAQRALELVPSTALTPAKGSPSWGK
jgi:hypothetical protein